MTTTPSLLGGQTASEVSPLVEKVFLALRPNFFPGYYKEHVTLRYYNLIRWDVLVQDAARMEKHLPTRLVPAKYDHWYAWGDKRNPYKGLILEKNSMLLEHLQMPHITLSNEAWNAKPLLLNLEPQAVSTIWVGKSIKGSLVWAPLRETK